MLKCYSKPCVLQIRSLWIFSWWILKIQNQPPEVFCNKRCSKKFHKIHRKTPVPESLFLLKKRLLHRCFPVNFVKFLRTPFYRIPLSDCFYIFAKKFSKCKLKVIINYAQSKLTVLFAEWLWKIHMRGQYLNWDSMNVLNKVLRFLNWYSIYSIHWHSI